MVDRINLLLQAKNITARQFAEEIGIYGPSYANTMMVDLGETLYFASGSERNIKITTTEDIEIFKAFLNTKRDTWLK